MNTPEFTIYLNATCDEIVIDVADHEMSVIPYATNRSVFDGLDFEFHDDMNDIIMYAVKRIKYYDIEHTDVAFDLEEGIAARYERHSIYLVYAFFNKRMHGMNFEYGICLTQEQTKSVPSDKIINAPWYCDED